MSNVAKSVITRFGDGNFRRGVPVVAEILRLHKTRVYRMTYAKEKGGTGGVIGAEYHLLLLEGARRLGVNLKPCELVLGARTDLPEACGQCAA